MSDAAGDEASPETNESIEDHENEQIENIEEQVKSAENPAEENDEEELKQLEEELQEKDPAPTEEADGVDKARLEKLERMKLLRKRKKEVKAAKKLAAQPEEPHLKTILAALESSFDGKEFEVLTKIVQPNINDLKSAFYRIRGDLKDALLRYYPVVDIKVFGSCVTDMAFNGE